MVLLEDNYNKALEEIKRADHLVHVTLKYTRTADVIRNILDRLINAFESTFLEYLRYLKEKGEIKQVPDTVKARLELFKLKFKGKIKNFIDIYILIKKIYAADYGKKEEFRKHVTLIAHLGRKDVNVDIVLITNFYFKTREFFILVHEEMRK